MTTPNPPSDHIPSPAAPDAGPPLSASQLLDEARRIEREGRRDEARAFYERALRALPRGDEPPGVSAILRWIARTYQEEADFDAALDCLTAARAVASAMGDEGAMGHALNIEAVVWWQRGDLDAATRLYHEAEASARRAGDARLAAMTAQNLGVIANVRGDLRDALRHYETSLHEYRKLGLEPDTCGALNNLGMLYTDLRRWDDAAATYAEALELAQRMHDVRIEAQLEVNIAELCVGRGDADAARAACDRAVALANRVDERRVHGEAFKLLGIIARDSGDPEGADAYLRGAQESATEREDLLLLAETAREQAELCRQQGRNRETLQHLNRAHKIFRQMRARRDLADVARRNSELESDFLEVVRRWGESIESKDRYTQGHCERVADISCSLAARTGMDASSMFWFRIGALLHDVGKLIIPEEVLNKPGKLTDDEWALMKRHTVAGVELLADIEFPWDVRPIVESHHERWDGKGYPHGLAGEAIPQPARILCIADVYDALTSQRSYKKSMTHADAMNVMRRDVGTMFDPTLFAIFEDVIGARMGAEAQGTTAEGPVAPPAPDALTGLPLRRAFLAAATRLLAERQTTNDPVSLMFVDVVGLDAVNATYGAARGDDVLVLVAGALRAATRATDVAARYAGHGFVVVLPKIGPNDAVAIAERTRTTILRAQRASSGDGAIANIAIGVAAAPDHGSGIEALIHAASRASHDVREREGGGVTLASTDLAPAQDTRPALTRVVGRVQEGRRLLRLLDTTRRGEPALVVLTGEPGVGCHVLLSRLSPDIRLRGGSIVRGRCPDAEVPLPLAPWKNILAELERLALVPPRTWAALPALLPALGDHAEPRDWDPRSSILFDELAAYLRLASSASPLTIVLEDVQRADAMSLRVVEELLRRFTDERVLLCLTSVETPRVNAPAAVRRLLRDARATELKPTPLSSSERREWISDVFTDAAVHGPLLDLLARHDVGNPLAILHALHGLIECGGLAREAGAWRWNEDPGAPPFELVALLQWRIGRLTPRVAATLATLSVLGTSFDLDVALATETGSEADLLDALDEAIAAGLVVHDGSRMGDRFAFAHTSVGDALRGTLTDWRLRRAHERAAAAIEQRAPGAVGVLLHHLDRGGRAAEACDLALKAADEALTIGAGDDAQTLLAIAERNVVTREQQQAVNERVVRVRALAAA